MDTLSIARELIGCMLVSISGEGTTAGRIVEAEAYLGKADSAAHAFRGRVDGRTEVLYRQGGYAYVFLIYGMYSCFNVSTGPEGVPECVLIRALEPLEVNDVGMHGADALTPGKGKAYRPLQRPGQAVPGHGDKPGTVWHRPYPGQAFYTAEEAGRRT